MQLAHLALAEVALKTLREEIDGQLADVRAAIQCELDDTGVRTLDARLPDGTQVGTISRSTSRPKAAVVDEPQFRAWVEDHTGGREIICRSVCEVRAAYRAKLLAEMTQAGAAEITDPDMGEILAVPGVEVTAPRAASHTVRVSDEQQAAIITAWRTGQLAALDLPQLTAVPRGGKP